MLPTRLFQPKGKSRAQALVEFSLTAMLLLLTLTLIVEVARIFQAYVTLQAAARSGARYAITGQWMPQFAGDHDLTAGASLDSIKAMRSGWDENSGDPYLHIPPCWPRFSATADQGEEGDNLPDTYTTTRPVWDEFEPYRDPRTCSIEHTVIRGLTGLPLDPSHADRPSTVGADHFTPPTQPGPRCCYTNLYETYDDKGPAYTYEIQVLGYTNDMYPNDDTYWRPDPEHPSDTWQERDYANIYQDTLGTYDGEQPGMARGYGGDPGKKVLVRVKYRLGLITPILSRIVPWIELTGFATMTNESFGSTGVQSNAVLPPPLPPFETGEAPDPPDLVIQAISLVTAVPPNPSPNETDFKVSVTAKNQSEMGLEEGTILRLYGVKTTQLGTPYTAAGLASSGTLFGEVPVPIGPFGPNGTFTNEFTFQFPSSGTWYLYAFIDSGQTVDEIGATGDTARENNNISHYGAPTGIIATSDADLEVTKTVSDVAPAQNQEIFYKIVVKNLGSANATGVVVTDVLPGGVTCVSSDLPLQYTCATGVWNVGAVPYPGSKTLNIKARVTAANGSLPIDNTASITGMAPTIFDPESGNNSDTATINVGAINLRMVKRVPSGSTDPIEGSSHPFTYILEVTNLSSATDAHNVTITDTLPSQVTYVSATGTGCSHASGVVTCLLNTVAAGATVRRDITVYANGGAGGLSLTNTASVVADEPDPDPDNDTSSVTVLVQSVDIRVTKTSNVLYSAQNTYFTWTIKVKNLGPDDATGVTIRDVIPTGMLRSGWTITTSTTPNPGSYSTSTSVWTIGNLPENTEETMTIRARTPTSTPNNTIVNNTASLLTSDQTDVNSGNNSDDAPITITDASAADLQMDKTVSPSSANTTTTEVIYTLKVTNNGPQDATGVKITDASLAGKLSTLFTWLGENSTPTGLTFNKTTGVVSVGNLAAGDSATIRIRVKPVFGVEPVFTNTATATKGSPTDDQNPDNNSDSATLNLEWPALIYVNPGGAGCGNPIEFGSSDNKLAPNDYTWEPTHPISAGTWGHYGSNYRLVDLPPTTQYSFLDDTPITTNPPILAQPFGDGSAGQNLMGCAITGSDFSYRFNNLVPGVYDIVLVFADPYYGIGKRRFTLVASTNGNSKRLFKNFDINNTIRNSGKAPRVTYNGVTYVRYVVKQYSFRVRDAGWMRLRFSKGTHRTGYINYQPIVSGIGIRYRGS